MSKKSKLTAALLLTGLPAAALAIALPFLHSTSNKIKNKEKIDALNKLKNTIDNSTYFLKKYPNIKIKSRQEIEEAIIHAKQIGNDWINRNERDAKSVVTSLIDSRHKLNLLLATALLKEDLTTDKDTNEAINEVEKYLLSYDVLVEFKMYANNFLRKKIDKNSLIKKSIELLDKQKSITFNVELDINIFRFKILNNIDDLNILFKSSALDKVATFIESRTISKSSRDVIKEYEIFFKNVSNELYEVESKNNAKLVKELYKLIDDSIYKVEQMQINSESKKMLQLELRNLKNFVKAVKGNLSFKIINEDSKNIDFKEFIIKYISSFFAKTSQYFKGYDEVVSNLQKNITETKQKINNLEAQFRTWLKNIISQTELKIKEDKNNLKIYELYSDFVKSTQLIFIASTLLKENIRKVNSSNVLNNQEKDKYINELKALPYDNALDYFLKSNEIMSDFEYLSLIRNFVSERLNNLKKQYEFSKTNAIKTGLNKKQILKIDENIKKINNLKQNKVTFDQYINQFETLINEERLINKQELKHIIKLLEEEFSKQTIKNSPNLVSIWNKDLLPILTDLTDDFSTATRNELNEQIKENNSNKYNAIRLLTEARLANFVNSISDKNTILLNEIEKEFSSLYKEKAIFENKVQSLLSNAKNISIDKNLTEEQKISKLKEIAQKQEQLSKNMHDLAKLAEIKNKTGEILNRYKDNENAKIYFANEIKNVSELRNEAEDILNNPIDISSDFRKLNKIYQHN
ncbi:hypothetical protein [Metamycoplasma canadense]|uniref:hypothetical protein n=1 Tax=Metamycoplasma canadense TaxID=29554 RepID=UPI0005EDD434|nr:hypothetical protein [Metamycoplasma canadense]